MSSAWIPQWCFAAEQKQLNVKFIYIFSVVFCAIRRAKTRDYDLLFSIFFLAFFPVCREKRKMLFSQIPEQNSEKEKERKRKRERNVRIYNRRMTKHILSSIFFFSSLVYNAESTYLLPHFCRKQTFSRNYNTRVTTRERRTSLSNDHTHYWSILPRFLRT